ncbi:hypothetical protein KC19_4G105200 [Ceratodon purpureus]|uniref:Purple acid phosphatase n=1 Tax=Ceratodon purpureus TaxID=3225 RepID=A0A8T0I779_CERPU|nr:hypothetical protein KC19_4G105200 [Ceratodon purpureus]
MWNRMGHASVHHILCISMVVLFVKVTLVGAVSLELSTTTLTSSGATVNISWNDLESLTKYDWLGIYTPPESLDNHYIGYINLSEHTSDGKGFFSFPAVNMRAPYEFRLFRGYPPTADTALDEDSLPIPSTVTRLAVSHVVEFSNYNEPTQVHLSLTSNPTEMAVMYVTKEPVKTSVRYGKESDNLSHTSIASAHTYEQKDMCHAPANSSLGWRDPGYTHFSKMIELEPGVRYFYQVGSTESGWSKIFSFVAPEINGAETNALLFGDMGTYVPYKTFNWVQYESVNTMKWLQRDLEELGTKPTLVSHIGDIAYARGYSWLWDSFFQQVEPVAASTPWHVCIGNHEYNFPSQPFKPDWAPYGKDGGGECGVPYSMRFAMPGWTLPAKTSNVPDTKNLYYSLDSGVVHFVWISTETDFTPGSDQYNWIAEDLKNTNRQKTPFIVLQGHRPMYSTDNKAMRIMFTTKLIEYLEPLLVEHKVSLALWGHVHKYERTCPLQNKICMDKGVFPVHLVIGMGGQDWQPIDQPRSDRPSAPIFPQPPWSMFRSFEFGYIKLHANKTLMTVRYIGSHDGQVHDVVEFSSPILEDHESADPDLGARESFGEASHSVQADSMFTGISMFPLTVAFVLGGAVTGVALWMYSRQPLYVRVQG